MFPTSRLATAVTRRSFFRAVAAPAVAAAVVATAGAAVPTPSAADVGAQLQAGLYQGYWHDGRAMVERVTVTPSEITLHRVAGGDVQGHTARFIRSGPASYNSPNGHRIFITGSKTFTWTNSNGQNGVSYFLLK